MAIKDIDMHTEAETLRTSLCKAMYENENADTSISFLLETDIESLLEPAVIKKCLEESDINPIRHDECYNAIFPGGRKVFAILTLIRKIGLIYKFLRSDQMNREALLDSRLPFQLDYLNEIFHHGGIVEEFYEWQWRVAVPFLRQQIAYRRLDHRTILPFIGKEALSEGSIGEVDVVTVAAGQHDFGSKATGTTKQGQIKVVRKTFRPGQSIESASKMFKNEENILTLLRSLRHPNIVQLLASYVLKNESETHVLLFTRADYTLSEMLISRPIEHVSVWNDQFPTHYDVFQSLYGLASAIQSLHEYGSPDFEIELVGCHFDLAPRNILVHNKTFLLADFGLSRMKSDTSKTMFSAGAGDYVAPECRPVEEGSFTKGIVSRKSDIWSFGCVVLEILTYMRGGADEVRGFREHRRDEVCGFISAQFHSSGRSKQCVLSQLDTLEANFQDVSYEKLFDILREMLEIEPGDRPDAKNITPSLFMHAQKTLFDSVHSSFEALINDHQKELMLKIEMERLILWAWSANLVDKKQKRSFLRDWIEVLPKQLQFHNSDSYNEELMESARDWLSKSHKEFDQVNNILLLIRDEITTIEGLLQDASTTSPQPWPIHKRLQKYISNLWILMPTVLYEEASKRLENKILDTDDRQLLQDTKNTLNKNDSYPDIARMVAVKHMIAEVSKDENEDCDEDCDEDLFWKHEVPCKQVGMHQFGKIRIAQSSDKDEDVLVERITYSSEWAKSHGDVQNRISKLAKMLNVDESPAFRTLKCIKYFDEPAMHSFGLLYELPRNAREGNLTPITLKELIMNFQKPELGALFRLANIITGCIASFHKTNWLHKNISSHNILLFEDRSEISGENKLLTLIQDVDSRHRPVVSRANETTNADVGSPKNDIPIQRSSILHKLKHKWKLTKPKIEVPKDPSPQPTEIAASQKPQQSPKCSDTRRIFPPSYQLNSPYLVGLNHTTTTPSNLTFTTTSSQHPNHRIYQHPSYQTQQNQVPKSDSCFQVEYDYFSTGLVLLEMGMWDSLENLLPEVFGDSGPGTSSSINSSDATNLKKNTSISIKQFLESEALAECIAKLAGTMGKVYMDAVTACIYGGVGNEESEGEGGDGEEERIPVFRRVVVGRIRECRA